MGDRDELLRALTTVASGGSVVDPRIVDALLSAQQHRGPLAAAVTHRPRARRPPRDGRRPHQPAIARELHVFESAVSKYISSSFAKLQLPDDDPTVDRRVRAVLTYGTGATAESSSQRER